MKPALTYYNAIRRISRTEHERERERENAIAIALATRAINLAPREPRHIVNERSRVMASRFMPSINRPSADSSAIEFDLASR